MGLGQGACRRWRQRFKVGRRYVPSDWKWSDQSHNEEENELTMTEQWTFCLVFTVRLQQLFLGPKRTLRR